MKKSNNKTKKVKEAFEKIVQGATNIISSGKYEEFLKFSKNFHDYSIGNRILIYSQMRNATQVAGFKKWESMGRKLKKGAKGIQIIYPIKRKYTTKIEGQASIIKNEEEKQEETVEYISYGYTYVYDISQTVGKPVPKINNTLTNDIGNYTLDSNTRGEFLEFLKKFSPYPVLENNLSPGLFGYWSKGNKHIVLRKSLSIDDKVSTLLHELTHALYDDFNYQEDKMLSEIFVESVAYIVADYFDLDTSKCSFNYINNYANGDIKVILDLGDKIQKTSNAFIKQLKGEFENKNIKIAS